MRGYAYKKVNAFTSDASDGNPAAFIDLGGDEIDALTMLKIAKEHQGFVSEFIFAQRTGETIKLTYYSSECEIAFCGHGTIATMYEIIRCDPELLAKKELEIETNKKGRLTVYNEIPRDGAIFITAPEATQFAPPVTKEAAASALGLAESAVSRDLPLDFIDAGLRTLIVPISSLSDEISVYPEQKSLESFCVQNGVDIILIFSIEAANPAFFAHTRVFAPKFGYLEDPATGSGNSAFGYYLMKNGLWDGGTISIEQGGNRMAYNTVKLIRRDGRVLFGGQAKKKIDGVYYID